jgi:hypothetical protein
MARAMPKARASARMPRTESRPVADSANNTAAAANSPPAPTRMMRRRSTRSARWPAGSASRAAGRNSMRPTRPSLKASWVISYMCQASAVAWICSPMVHRKFALA